MTIMIALAVAALASFFVWRFLNGDGAVPGAGSGGAPKMKPGAKIVDVRTKAEFRASHLQGAVNIPLQVLSQRLTELGPKSGQVILYCKTGARSAKAAIELQSAGFTDVVDGGAMRNLSAPAGSQDPQQPAPVNRQQRRMQQRAARRKR